MQILNMGIGLLPDFETATNQQKYIEKQLRFGPRGEAGGGEVGGAGESSGASRISSA